MSTEQELKTTFWEALADSPFLFLHLDNAPGDAVPMTAQLDTDADAAIWFFTTKDNCLAKMGPATAIFAGKNHQVFARFSGLITEEYSRERRDKHWSSVIESWFPGGKEDPDLIMLRMDLGKAEIWNSDMGFVDNVKMLLGFDTREEAKKEHTETLL